MSERILLFGPNGQLGTSLAALLGDRECELVSCARDSLDLCATDAIAGYVADVNPDWVINCAAYTQVDKAESEQALAQLINRDAAAAMARGAEAASARFIHVSTDFVFDGGSHHPYLESDATNPLSVYGLTKLQGE